MKLAKFNDRPAVPQAPASHDIGSLFSRFHTGPSVPYQELQRQQAAQAVIQRWPLLSDVRDEDDSADSPKHS